MIEDAFWTQEEMERKEVRLDLVPIVSDRMVRLSLFFQKFARSCGN